MSEHSPCFQVILKRGLVSRNIYAISKSAYDYGIGIPAGKLSNKLVAELYTIFCRISCTNNAYYMPSRKIGYTFII